MYEKEVFSECGAWKNFDDLEDSLTLEELLELYDSASERQIRIAKVIAGSMGAEFDEPESSSSQNGLSKPDSSVVYDQYDLQQLPFGVGYETID